LKNLIKTRNDLTRHTLQNNHQEHKFVFQLNIRTGIGATKFVLSVTRGSFSRINEYLGINRGGYFLH